MSDWTDIANLALVELGKSDPRITSLDDDNGKRARALKSVYLEVTDAVTRAHPWNCAMARAKLAADADAPAFGFDYQYTLPTDPWCLRVWEIDNDPKAKFKVEGRKLLTNRTAPLPILFIKQVRDPGLFDADLVTCLATRWAAAAAFEITGRTSLADKLYNKYLTQLPTTKSVDGQEDGREDDPFESEWIEARRV